MTRNGTGKIVAATTLMTILAGGTLSAQNKYDLKVPGGLAFSEFKGDGSHSLAARPPEAVVRVITTAAGVARQAVAH